MNRTRPDNDPRFDRSRRAAHTESWFLRANHPTEPKALWLKATILGRTSGTAVAEVWCSLFDACRARGGKATVPIEHASFSPGGTRIHISDCEFELGAEGRAVGHLPDRRFAWDLRWKALPSSLGAPLCPLPSRRLLDARFPKNKLLTPHPVLHFEGTVTWGDEAWQVHDWLGMQGHNWGQGHSPEYAWGQCVFSDARGEPFAMVEAASGRLRLGPVVSPVLALMVIRHDEQELRFDRLVDLWNREALIASPTWTLRMQGPDGEAVLSMRARPERMVCLGYEDPGGHLSYCLNSKLAEVTLRVNPVNRHAFVCRSAHGGALEFLQGTPVPVPSEVV